MVGAAVAILLFLYVITVFQSCKTPKPVAETISNTEVKHDSTTNTTTETEVKETIKESGDRTCDKHCRARRYSGCRNGNRRDRCARP